MITSRIPAVTIVLAAATTIGPLAGCTGAPSTYIGSTAAATQPSASAPNTRSSASAAAPNQMSGAYKVVTGAPDDVPNRWVFTPCGDGCADVDIPEGDSTAHARARVVDNQWTLDKPAHSAVRCGDGSSGPGTAHFSWNPVTLTGRYWGSPKSGACGSSQASDTQLVPLTLTKVS